MKLDLKKQELSVLSEEEMQNVEGGRGGWSNFRTGKCNYSEDHAKTECVIKKDRYGNQYQEEVLVGCNKSSTSSVTIASGESTLVTGITIGSNF